MKRSRRDMELSVLGVVSKEALIITHIMTKANLSWGTTRKILGVLTDSGLLRAEVKTVNNSGRFWDRKPHKLYFPTDKGRAVLKEALKG